MGAYGRLLAGYCGVNNLFYCSEEAAKTGGKGGFVKHRVYLASVNTLTPRAMIHAILINLVARLSF